MSPPGNRDGREGMARAFADGGYMMPDCAFVHYAVEEHPVRLVTVDSLAADAAQVRRETEPEPAE
jgi:Icc protein